MNPSSYDVDVLRSQMAILRQAAKDRAALEESIPAQYEQAVQALRKEQETVSADTEKQVREKIHALKQQYEAILSKIESTASSDRAKLEDQRNQLTAKVGRKAQTQEEKLREDFEFDDSAAKEIHKEKRQKPKKLFRSAEKEIKKITEAVNECEKRTLSFVSNKGVSSPEASENPPKHQHEKNDECLKSLQSSAEKVVEQSKAICNQPEANRVFSTNTIVLVITIPIILGIFLSAGAAFGSATAKLPTSWIIAVTASSAGVVIGGGVGCGLWWLMRRRRTVTQVLQTDFNDLCDSIAHIRQCLEHSVIYVKKRLESQTQLAEQQIKEDIEKRNTTFKKRLHALSEHRQQTVADLETKASDRTKSISDKQSRAKEDADQKYPQALSDLETHLASQLENISQQTNEKLNAAKHQRDSDTEKMVSEWKEARTKTASIYSEADTIDTASFLPWDKLAQPDIALPHEAPPGLRFGHLALSLSKIPGGISPDPALNKFGPTDWTQPATVPFPTHASLLIKTLADQQETASAMLQALTLRVATGIPPGQSRFTIIDPLGLGKQFAGFMHLADHDELLVTSRIWTEPQQIDERLSDLTEQMEVVIQKYLRNEYESIGDYNAEAEVPEPYRFVVVANFPANFNETSARRLMSIAASGARCGVYVIVSVDTKQIMPSGFSLEAFEKLTTTLTLKDGQFTWDDQEFSQWPLSVEEAPPDAIFTDIIQRVGKEAKAAKRVEVPFDRVAPPEDAWWEGSTATEVLAPLGPAGAKKLQFLKLGKGTSQHALIAGKTGSGKSTLMHAMITSLALQYSPNEIQFYLIDFKKGVEFKLYDHYALPHARVIAIESEREFGLSVLEQLDKELKRRGDLFRELSVQNVDGFRKTDHPDPMPRILLVIDEFQEIFVEDDKIAQDASLILDRLVRQGRAFGM
ncbi:MAG: FtsK/SpoIIIE domain-containing protein, partial [Pirellulales bacterium]